MYLIAKMTELAQPRWVNGCQDIGESTIFFKGSFGQKRTGHIIVIN